MGAALSELSLIGSESETANVSTSSGFPRLPPVAGHVITVEMVHDALDTTAPSSRSTARSRRRPSARCGSRGDAGEVATRLSSTPGPRWDSRSACLGLPVPLPRAPGRVVRFWRCLGAPTSGSRAAPAGQVRQRPRPTRQRQRSHQTAPMATRSTANHPSHTSVCPAPAGRSEVFPTASNQAADAPGRTRPTGVTMSSWTRYSPRTFHDPRPRVFGQQPRRRAFRGRARRSSGCGRRGDRRRGRGAGPDCIGFRWRPANVLGSV